MRWTEESKERQGGERVLHTKLLSSYFIGDVTAKETFGTKEKNQQKNGESDHVFPVRAIGDESSHHRLEDAQDQAAAHRAGNISDSPQHRRREGFDARNKSHVVFD